jgi:alpha-L-rhamnosidase
MTSTSAPVVSTVRAELRTDSTDVADPRPRLSWTTTSTTPNWEQVSAEIELDGGTVASSLGRDSVLVAWPFEPIAVRARHSVRVRVTGNDGAVSDWSAPLEVVSGFLADGDWVADMIGLAAPARVAQPALLRTSFAVGEQVARDDHLISLVQGRWQEPRRRRNHILIDSNCPLRQIDRARDNYQ